VTQAKDKARALWLLAAASKALRDDDAETALRIMGDAAQVLGCVIVADVKATGRGRR
jgi:hypothetical protein